MSDLTGKTVAGYPIEKLLAKGSYADTYQVSTSGAPLAVRIIQPGLRGDAAVNTAMAKGWELSRAATHPSLVTAFGANVDNDVGAYCLQELVHGKALRTILLDGSRLAWRDFIIIGEQLLGGVQALHKAGVLHGDIWSGSIQITQDQDLKLEGAGGLMYVPRRSTELLSGPSMAYQAPEVLRGSPITVESDIYAVGGCLYAVLAGHDPYPPESAERLVQLVTERKLPSVTALREDFPPVTDEFLTRMMAKDPTQRYAQASDALADLMRLKENKPLAPLKGGKPAAAALPSSAPAPVPAPAPASRSSSNPAVGSRPPSAGRSGFGSAIGAKKPISGLGAAVASSGNALQAIKEGSTAGRIFGRLDTHVKSTIPQTDLEKRGDDLYRQGQLPLALNCWREAFENSPHTGLKVKVDLAERDVKREAYSNALEEARMRLDDGDFGGAIARSREALLTAEDEQQRREVLNVERDAIEKLEKERYVNRIKMISGGVVLLILTIVSLIYLSRKSADSTPPDVPVAPPAPPPVATTPANPQSSNQVFRFKFESAKALVTYTAPWSPQGTFLAYLFNNQRAAVLTAGKLPGGPTPLDVMKQLRAGKMFKDATSLEDNDYAFTIEGNYWVSKLLIRYTGEDGDHLHYYFVVAGPNNTVCLAEADGREDQLTPEVRDQIHRVMTTWHYEK